MKKLCILADSPGSAEFIFPVIPRLMGRFECHIITVKDPPTRVLSAYHPIRVEDEKEAERVFEIFKPDALCIGTSSLIFGPFVAKTLVRNATFKKLPIVCYQDYWANHRSPMNKEIMDLWHITLVPDILAEKFLREDGYHGKIIITGHPGFEKFSTINVKERRSAVRNDYAIPNNGFLILYAGAATPFGAEWDMITFRFFIDAISRMDERPIIIATPHPRDEDPMRYMKIAAEKNISVLNLHAHQSSDDILPGTDAVIGMYATTLLHACYLRIPAISILLPDAGAVRLAKINLKDFPPNEIGASIGIYESSPERLIDVCACLQKDSEYRNSIRNAQEKLLPWSEILPSQIAAEAIENFLIDR